VEDLRHGISKLRNRVIGRVFHELGLIEQWGSGIQRMTTACREAGLAEPALEEIGTRFRVTIHTVRSGIPSVEKTDQAILDALAAGEGLSTREIAAAIESIQIGGARVGEGSWHQPAGPETALLSGGITANDEQ
jgi:predicted HTH transcriptional regulator